MEPCARIEMQGYKLIILSEQAAQGVGISRAGRTAAGRPARIRPGLRARHTGTGHLENKNFHGARPGEFIRGTVRQHRRAHAERHRAPRRRIR